MDTETVRHYQLGEMIEECYRASVRAWRSANAASIPLDDLFALHLRRVETRVEVKPKGRVDIEVTCHATDETRTELTLFRAARRGATRYEILDSTLALYA